MMHPVRDRLLTAKLTRGGALALAFSGFPLRQVRPVAAATATPDAGADASPLAQRDSPFRSALDVLNYALTLEHLENAYYRAGLDRFGAQDFVAVGYEAVVRDSIVEIGKHEAAHVETLTAVIRDLGGTPVRAGRYDVGSANVGEFLGAAQVLENVGVAAYTGAAQYLIGNDELLTAALTIHGVEARHAAYLSLLTGISPFPHATEAPLTPEQALEAAGLFAAEERGEPTREARP